MYKLLGKNDIEDALKRLDMLTTEEARMATAENSRVTNRVDVKVDRVDNKVDKMDGKMDDKFDKVDNKVERVDGKVERVDGKVDKVDVKVDKVDVKVDNVDNKVTVLIDGGQIGFLATYTFLKVNMVRCERSKRAVCEHRR